MRINLRLTERKSTSRIMKCSDMESVIAPINHLLHQGGITTRDWFSEMLWDNEEKTMTQSVNNSDQLIALILMSRLKRLTQSNKNSVSFAIPLHTLVRQRATG